MRSVRLSARNYAVGNVAVIVAVGFMVWTNTAWLNLNLAAEMTAVYLSPGFQILSSAAHQLAEANREHHYLKLAQRFRGRHLPQSG